MGAVGVILDQLKTSGVGGCVTCCCFYDVFPQAWNNEFWLNGLILVSFVNDMAPVVRNLLLVIISNPTTRHLRDVSRSPHPDHVPTIPAAS